MKRLKQTAGVLAIGLLTGCAPPMDDAAVDNQQEKKSIIGQRTQEVGEFDKNAGREVVQSDVHNASNPITGAMKAYGPAISKIAKMNVTRALRMFQATHGRYPKDHAEFMQRIIKEGQIELPKLPGGDEYQYDVENHCLVIVEGKKSSGN